MCDEGSVDHVPEFFIVLKFLIDHLVEEGAAFAYGIASEFRKNVGHRHVVLVADPFDIFDDLLDHVLIVEVEGQRCLNGKASTDVDGVQRVADLAEFAILENETAQLAPVIGSVLNAGIDKEMEHLQ